ncbi:MAG: nitrate transporter ATP-binding protein [Firmicutes bacterium]|nr:nitrate transporter ATP-binding protein [Bacillota bacterium]
MTQAKIQLRGVSKSFNRGTVTALDKIDLDIHQNEVFCIVGPSGCGKTTLLRLLNGLIQVTEGSVMIDGRDADEAVGETAMVFQHFGLFPWKTVYENVAYGLRLRRRPKDEIDEQARRYIGMTGLKGFEYVYPHQLSGGMRQRAGLARALAVHSNILLMDEPFAALDAQTREFLQDELAGIWAVEQKTVVFITHSIDEAVFLGDRVAIMTPRPGRVKEILKVDLPRPRDMIASKSDPRYMELRNYIWTQLKEDGQGGNGAVAAAGGER